jgi:hypothetical protein
MDACHTLLKESEGPVDFKLFADERYHIATAQKAELRNWKINYYDELPYYIDPASNICPEILGDGTLGPCVVQACLNSPEASDGRGRIFVQLQRTASAELKTST